MSILAWYEYCCKIPLLGSWIFGWMVAFASPYTGTISMRIKELKPGHCSAYMSDWFMMRNPFKSIHAVALMNLGEAVGGFAVLTWAERSQYRAIVTKLEIEFLKKARGTIRGQCDLNEKLLPKAGQSGDIVLTTVLRDNADDIVAKITSHWKLSPEKKRI